jgi:hypothetical protein
MPGEGTTCGTRRVEGRLVGYARVSTDDQDLTAQRDSLVKLGVKPERIYVDHGLTGSDRARPGLREAMAACHEGDTLVVTKLDRLARSLPDARDIIGELTGRDVRLSIGGSVHAEVLNAGWKLPDRDEPFSLQREPKPRARVLGLHKLALGRKQRPMLNQAVKISIHVHPTTSSPPRRARASDNATQWPQDARSLEAGQVPHTTVYGHLGRAPLPNAWPHARPTDNGRPQMAAGDRSVSTTPSTGDPRGRTGAGLAASETAA